ncbi:hypothetical protein [Streptosporangium saharense]|uniref:Uncharacterized protein n=1 Tax=Streptosporangium saharense TaxID=1706840 RepID=A0A7W7QVJ3_9ACTN|nr:hypothetical protein [Streptosporangium saharense]MBB4920571.1 hypothetical protein [Streptosporangium saharense]
MIRASSPRGRKLLRVVGAALAVVMAMTSWVEVIAPARAASAACMAAHHDEDHTAPAKGPVSGPAVNTATGPPAATSLGDEQETFENDSREIKDDSTDTGATDSRPPVRGVTVAIHRARPSETSLGTSVARGPPVRRGRLLPGVSRAHDLRPKTAGADRPRPCEDLSDVRTARPEDP